MWPSLSFYPQDGFLPFLISFSINFFSVCAVNLLNAFFCSPKPLSIHIQSFVCPLLQFLLLSLFLSSASSLSLCLCKLQLWRESRVHCKCRCVLVKKPTENFQTRSFTVRCLVYVGKLNAHMDIRNSCDTPRKMPQSVKKRNAWRTAGISFATGALAQWVLKLNPHFIGVKHTEGEADQS